MVALFAALAAACGQTDPTPTPRPVPQADGVVAVTRNGPGTLTRVDLVTGHSGSAITISGTPAELSVSPDGKTGYALDSQAGTVIPVDLSGGHSKSAVKVGQLPTAMVLSRNGANLYVIDNLTGSLVVLDTKNLSVKDTFHLGSGLAGLEVAPNQRGAAISAAGAPNTPGQIALLDLATENVTPMAVGRNPVAAMQFTPDDTILWVLEDAGASQPSQLFPVTLKPRSIGAAINVGRGASSMAITPDGKTIAVANGDDATLTLVDTASRTAAAPLAVGGDPTRVRISDDGLTAWVTCLLSKTLLPVALQAPHTVAAGLPIVGSPVDVRLDSRGGAWVLNPVSSGNVASLDVHSNKLGGGVGTGVAPNLLLAPDGRSGWVVNSLSDSVQRLDVAKGSMGTPLAVAKAPDGDVLTPGGGDLLVISRGDGHLPGTLSVISTATEQVVATFPVGVNPSDLAVSSDGLTVYVVNAGSDTVTPIDLGSRAVLATIAVGKGAGQIVAPHAGTAVYVVCADARTVVPIAVASNTALAPISVGIGPQAYRSRDGQRIYVVGRGDQSLRSIDVSSNQVSVQVQLPGNIVGLTESLDGTQLLAVDNASHAVDFLDPATLAVKGAVSVGARPGGLVITPNGKIAYALDGSAQTLTIIDVAGQRVLGTIDVSPGASDVIVAAPLN